MKAATPRTWIDFAAGLDVKPPPKPSGIDQIITYAAPIDRTHATCDAKFTVTVREIERLAAEVKDRDRQLRLARNTIDGLTVEVSRLGGLLNAARNPVTP